MCYSAFSHGREDIAGEQRKNRRKATYMEEEILNSAQTDTSAEMEQVAEAPRQGEGRTEQDAYYADRRRKQQLDRARDRISRLERQVARLTGSTDVQAEGQAEDGAEPQHSEETLPAEVELSTENLKRLVAGGNFEDNPAFLRAELQAVMQDMARQQGYAQEAERQQVQRQMAEDLKRIQQIDPGVLSLEDLPDTYMALRFNSTAPLTARQAYLATGRIQAVMEAKPQSTGSMTGGGKVEREYYTADELDRLTAKDLNNPAVMEKAMKSLSRLG